ncbi:tetratricopeptide repeat protein [Microvirga massiliensis]|uniref:tetratricopeptide repeat protein n=1 Tax=Microvirga massiliensis TaxID=1033741 RepID=UPI00062BB33B|nr:tetratricopeptide repeat protein [Microvirga massiliensis]
MATARVERRLAAILAADVVGYSRLMERDEPGTFTRLKQLRHELVEPILARHGGRFVDLKGDGAIVEFGSAVEAVEAAVEIQRAMLAQDAELPEDWRIRYRIGINLGDVIADGGTIYGDGVNVAARIESLCEPGGVWLSRSIYNQVRGKLDLAFAPSGLHQVKNISEAVETFRVALDGAGPGPAPPRPGVHAPRVSRWLTPAMGALMVVALLVIGAAIIGWQVWWSSGEMTGASLETRRVAVLPLANLSDEAADEYFSDGMMEELISRLSRISKLSVIARTSVMKYKGTKQDIAEIGRTLQVGTILEGSVRRAGDRVRITAQLIDVASQAHLWSEDYDRTLKDVFAIQSDIAKQVAEALQITLLANEQEKIKQQHTIDPVAHNMSLKGMYFYNQGGVALNESRAYFEQAIERDPGYAMAYARLADLYLKLQWFMPVGEAYAKARAAAEKAVELDDRLAEAHSALATVKVFVDRDWSGAEQEFKKAIALNPSSALAHAEYGHKLLSAVKGRYDDALAELRRAQELDPLAVYISMEIAYVYYHARQWDQAIAQFQRTIELSSKSPFPHLGLGQTYAKLGRFDEAVSELDKALALGGTSNYFKGTRGWGLGLAGRTDEARQVLRELQEAAAQEKVDPVTFAYIYSGLGDHERAILWLRKAYEEGSAETIFLRTPSWDNMRSDPHFIELMHDVGLATD